MSQILGSLSVPIHVDASKVSASFNMVHGRLASLTGAFARFNRGLMFPALGGGLLGGGAIGLGLKQAADLETSFTTLARTTGLGGAEMAKFQGEIKKLAVELAGVKLDDILAISAIGGRMGIQGAALSRFTRDIAMVKIVLSDIPTEEVTNGIARILNVFDLGTENAIRFASALNRLDQASTATGRDILDISTRIAPAAAILGLVPQKVMAISAALKDAGARNEVAGTAMSQILGMMARKTGEFARVSGVSTKTFSDALRRDPLEALKLLTANIEKMDKLKAFSALEKLGLDGQRTMMTLLQLGTVMGKVDEYVAEANSEWSTLSSINQQIAINSQTTYAQLKKLGNGMRLLAAEAGTYLLPVVKALAGSFGDLALEMRAALEANRGHIETFVAKLTTAARYVSLAFSEWPTMLALAGVKVAEFADRAGEVLKRIGAALWGGMMAGAGAALQFLRNSFKVFGSFLADLFTSVGENIKAQIASIWDRKIVIPEIRANFALLSRDKFMAGVKAPGLPSLGGLFQGLPDRAAQAMPLVGMLRDAMAAKDRGRAKEATNRAIGDFLNNLATGGGLGITMPGGAAGRALGALPRGLASGMPFGAMIRGALGGSGKKESKGEMIRRNRAAREAKRAARKLELSKAEADKRARAKARRPGAGAPKDEKLRALENIEDSNAKTAKATEDVAQLLKRGIVSRLA